MDFESRFASTESFRQRQAPSGDNALSSTIEDRIRKLYEEQLYHDVKIVVKGIAGRSSRNETFKAHKAILAIGSSVLAALLHNSQDQIVIANVDCKAFQNLLSFLYTDEISSESSSELLDTYRAAEKYNVPLLKQECVRLLFSMEITLHTVCQKLEISTAMKIPEMKERCLKFIQENTEEVFRSPFFRKTTTAAVKSIVKSQQLRVDSETDVLEAVMLWIKENHFSTKMMDSWELSRPYFDNFIKHIRFLSMSPEEFSRCLNQFKGLLTETESLPIFMAICGSRSTELPQWVNKEGKRCFSSVKPRHDHRRDTMMLISFGLTDEEVTSFRRVTSLKSTVGITCQKGCRNSYCLLGVKLQWKRRDMLAFTPKLTYVIRVEIFPSGYAFREKMQTVLERETSTFYFTKNAYISGGNEAKIEVEAIEIEGIEFLVADKNKMRFPPGVLFQLELESSEGDKRFLISEIYFRHKNRSNQEGRTSKHSK